MSEITRKLETDLDAVLGNRRGSSLVDLRAIASAEQIGDDVLQEMGGMELPEASPPVNQPIETKAPEYKSSIPDSPDGSIGQYGSDCFHLFLCMRCDTASLSMKDGLKFTAETLYPENHEEVLVEASKHLLHYENVRDKVAMTKASRIAARNAVVDDMTIELVRERVEKEFFKAKRASAKVTKKKAASFLAAKASDMFDVVLHKVMAAVEAAAEKAAAEAKAKANADAKARRAAEAKAKADAAKEAERKARHDEKVRIKQEKADAKAKAKADAEIEAARKAEEAALAAEYKRVTEEQKKAAKTAQEKKPVSKHDKKLAEQRAIAERALATADKLSDRRDHRPTAERAERERKERAERERKERAERERAERERKQRAERAERERKQREETEAIKQVQEFERLEAQRIEAARLEAERVERTTCGVCFKPYGAGMQQAMAHKCGGESTPECTMCLECLLGIAHSKGTRCLCGRENLDVRQWRPK